MILTPQDLRKVRPIANNINDLSRVEPYIYEAETLRAIDVLGARLYEWLANTKFESGEVYPFYLEGSPLDTTEPTLPDPRKKIEVDGDNIIKALDGGYWTDKCGCYKQTPGLKNAIAYLAYSRFLINNPVNPTAFGVVYKDGEFSTKVEDSILVRTAAEASKIGEAYLSKALEYFRHLGLLPECKTTPGAPSRNLIVRRHKL